MANTLSSPPVTDLVAFAAGAGHPDFPCLSRTHAPSSCVPCADFSPWLAERVRQGDGEAMGEYLWRLREANPGLGEPLDRLRQHYNALAARILAAPLEQHLAGGDAQAYLDLRVALVLLAVHEGFSGFIMTGEAADFVAAVMASHSLELVDADRLIDARNEFVREMGREMSYWAAWPMLPPEGLPPLAAPDDPSLRRLQDALLELPLGAREMVAAAGPLTTIAFEPAARRGQRPAGFVRRRTTERAPHVDEITRAHHQLQLLLGVFETPAEERL
jgi:hypothetical protein